ncbi:MAG TPA: cytochrome c [Candidatus Angelobacter sp.]
MKEHGLRWGGHVLLFLCLLWVLAVNFPLFAQGANKPAADTGQISHHSYDELAKAPDSARSRRNPLEGDSNAVAAGRKLFEQHCKICHGNTGEGGKKGPSLRAEEVRTATPGTLFWIMTNGVVRRGMPVWSKLPEQQRWQIVSYLKSLD